MYGLFKNFYDYYGWTDLVAVSAVKENLMAKAKDMPFPLLDGEEQKIAKAQKKHHLEIREVDEI